MTGEEGGASELLCIIHHLQNMSGNSSDEQLVLHKLDIISFILSYKNSFQKKKGALRARSGDSYSVLLCELLDFPLQLPSEGNVSKPGGKRKTSPNHKVKFDANKDKTQSGSFKCSTTTQ